MSLIRNLSKFADVEGVVVSDSNGEVDFHNGKISPDETASVSAVAVHELMAFGSLLGITGRFKSLVAEGKKSIVVSIKEENKIEKIATVLINAKTDGKDLLKTMSQAIWKAPQKKREMELKSQSMNPRAILSTYKVPPPPPIQKYQKKSSPSGEVAPIPSSTHSIPPTPEAHTLKNLRLALYFGDISGAKVLQVDLARFNYPNKRDTPEAKDFENALSTLTTLISKLLIGVFDVKEELKAFANEDEKLDRSLAWGGLIWQTRLHIARGNIDAAKEAALAAFQIAHDFDSDTRTANRCTIAGVYIMSRNSDKALKLLKSGSKTTLRCQVQAITGMTHLTESQALAMRTLYVQSRAAAKRAEEILPRSPYPKLMLARLSFLKKEYDTATSVYSKILALNPKQPDALSDLNILSSVQAGKLSPASVNSYFSLREMAPTEQTMNELTELHKELPEFEQLRSLLAWRLIGLEKIKEAVGLYDSGFVMAKTHRFKPNIVIGFGSSSVIAAGYHSIAARLESLVDNSASQSAPPAGEQPLYLSVPPEELQEMMDANSQDNLFSGELKMFSMPDLLEFLRNGHRTGSLICSSKHGIGAVELLEGYITSAIVPNGDNIGTLLLKKGKIKKADIAGAIDSQHKDLAGARIGAVLVEKGLVDAETIKEAIVEQTYSAIRTMLNWDDGRFAFTPTIDQEFDREFVEVKLDSQHVLMELFRQIDEQNR